MLHQIFSFKVFSRQNLRKVYNMSCTNNVLYNGKRRYILNAIPVKMMKNIISRSLEKIFIVQYHTQLVSLTDIFIITFARMGSLKIDVRFLDIIRNQNKI